MITLHPTRRQHNNLYNGYFGRNLSNTSNSLFIVGVMVPLIGGYINSDFTHEQYICAVRTAQLM